MCPTTLISERSGMELMPYFDGSQIDTLLQAGAQSLTYETESPYISVNFEKGHDVDYYISDTGLVIPVLAKYKDFTLRCYIIQNDTQVAGGEIIVHGKSELKVQFKPLGSAFIGISDDPKDVGIIIGDKSIGSSKLYPVSDNNSGATHIGLNALEMATNNLVLIKRKFTTVDLFNLSLGDMSSLFTRYNRVSSSTGDFIPTITRRGNYLVLNIKKEQAYVFEIQKHGKIQNLVLNQDSLPVQIADDLLYFASPLSGNISPAFLHSLSQHKNDDLLALLNISMFKKI